jgi:hypothetical protein
LDQSADYVSCHNSSKKMSLHFPPIICLYFPTLSYSLNTVRGDPSPCSGLKALVELPEKPFDRLRANGDKN